MAKNSKQSKKEKRAAKRAEAIIQNQERRKEKARSRSKIKQQNKNKKLKKEKEGDNMSWWWDQQKANKNQNKHVSGTPKKTTYSRMTAATKPTETQDPESLSVILYTQSSLDKIATLCKPEAGAAEFQVHHRGVQYVIREPESNRRLVFTIPTYYFNMPQKVTSASVDFNLDEVSAISEQIAPMSLAMAEDIDKAFPVKYFTDQGFEVSIRELEMGSLHRHPGNFGFSSTDLDNQVEKPGVIFRNLGCQDKIQVDSVMYIPGNTVTIVTTETRAVDVAPSDDGGIEGTYAETPTMCYILQDKATTGFANFFNAEEKSKYKFTVGKKWITFDYEAIEQVLSEFLDNMDYEAKLIVDPKLIEQEYARYNYTHNYKKPAKSYANSHIYSEYDEYDDDSDFYSYLKNDKDAAATPTAKVEILRPTWRKAQTLNFLRKKGVDLEKYDGCTGDASYLDIISVATSLKTLGKDDTEVRAFFKLCDYPVTAMEEYYTFLADATTDDALEATTGDAPETDDLGDLIKNDATKGKVSN